MKELIDIHVAFNLIKAPAGDRDLCVFIPRVRGPFASRFYGGYGSICPNEDRGSAGAERKHRYPQMLDGIANIPCQCEFMNRPIVEAIVVV